jgi:cytochrome P450
MPDVCPVDRYRYPADEVLIDPYEFYRELRNDQPVYNVPGTNVYIISRYEDAMYASQHPEIFSSKRVWNPSDDPEVARIRAQGFPDSNSLTGTDPPEHSRFRGLAVKVLSPRRFALLEPAVRALVNKLVDAFIADGEADLQRQFAIPLPLIVIADLLGLDHADTPDLKKWSDDYSEAMGANSKPLSHARVLECAQSLTDLQLYFSRKINERTANPGDDTISELIKANNALPDPVEHIILVDILRIFLIGGNETTALAIGTMMYQLLAKPEHFDRLVQDPSRIGKTIEESLRFESPTQWSGRNTTMETTLAGVTIPAGSRIYINWGAANRDPAKFPNAPDEFNPDRAEPGQAAFGYGPHFCVGSPLARMEMRITLEVFTKRLKNLRLANDEGPEFHPHSILRGLKKLNVKFDPGS